MPPHTNPWPTHGPLGGYQQSYTSYMQEERDVAPVARGAPAWMQQVRHSYYQ
jgi:hypothetical protein